LAVFICETNTHEPDLIEGSSSWWLGFCDYRSVDMGVENQPVGGWNEWQAILLSMFERRLAAIYEKGYQATQARKTLTALFLQLRGFKAPLNDILPEVFKLITAKEVNDSNFNTFAMMGHRFGMVENIADLRRYLQDIYGPLKPRGQVLLTSIDTNKPIGPLQKLSPGQGIRSERLLGTGNMQFQHENLIGPFFSMSHIKAETLKNQAVITNWQYQLVYFQNDDNYLALLSMFDPGQI